MNALVQRLSEGTHPVEISLRPEKTVQALKARIDDGYVHIKFTATRGGTELGVNLEKELSQITDGDFERGEGQIRLCGRLKLNYVPVRCVADIDLRTLAGSGHLEILEEAPAS
jgi:hypothetical protein